MDALIPYAFGGVATVFVAGFTWILNISSKVNVQERAHNDLKELINTKLDGIIMQVNLRGDMTSQRLARIEKALNGALNHE